VTAELHRAKRYQHPFSLVLLDVNRFKHINDEFGHTTGDAILRAVAERLTQRLRHVDLVARVGGDEFALLLPETDPQQARRVVDTLSAPLPVTLPPDRPGPRRVDPARAPERRRSHRDPHRRPPQRGGRPGRGRSSDVRDEAEQDRHSTATRR
jgi:GGDEF domain-containing protein